MAYTTRANVESYLRTTFTASTTPTDTEVDAWVTAVDSEIDRITGTTWSSQPNTEILDLRVNSNRFLVGKYPLISLTSIEYNDYTNADPAFNPNWVAFDNSRVLGDLIITDKTINVKQGAEVKLIYQWGHASAIPEVEFLATLLVAKKVISGDAASKSGTNSLSIGPLSITKNTGLSRLVNIDKNINEQIKRIGKYGTVFK